MATTTGTRKRTAKGGTLYIPLETAKALLDQMGEEARDMLISAHITYQVNVKAALILGMVLGASIIVLVDVVSRVVYFIFTHRGF